MLMLQTQSSSTRWENRQCRTQHPALPRTDQWHWLGQFRISGIDLVSSGSVPPSSDVLGKGFVWVLGWGGGGGSLFTVVLQIWVVMGLKCGMGRGGGGSWADGKGGRGVMSWWEGGRGVMSWWEGGEGGHELMGRGGEGSWADGKGGRGVMSWWEGGEGGHELMGVKYGSGQKLQFVLIFVWSNCFSWSWVESLEKDDPLSFSFASL